MPHDHDVTARHSPAAEAAVPSVDELRKLWRRGSVTSAPNHELSATQPDAASLPHPRGRMTEDEKVEKHRMIVRRSYYQKKELKHKLKLEIAALEERYQQLVGDAAQLQLFHGDQHHEPSSSSTNSHSEPPPLSAQVARIGGAPHCATCAQVQSLRLQYKKLSIAKEALLRQREALGDQLHDQQSFVDKVGQLVLQAEPWPSIQAPVLTVHTTEFPVSFEPLREEECFEMIGRAVQDVRSQSLSSDDFRDVGTHAVMGWNRKRTFGPRASFSLMKMFPAQHARTLWDATWGLYTDGTRRFEELYSGTVNMKFHILQRVNDNNVLFCRTLKTERLTVRNVTIFLFARFQHEGKFFILFRSVDKGRVNADHPADAVLSMFSWLSFRDHTTPPAKDDGFVRSHCEVEFGGTVPSAEVADTDFWMMEFLSYVMRLENSAIGPFFQVPP